jgi:hypothetical protein
MALERGEGVMSRSTIRLGIPIFARRNPAMRPVGPAPAMRTGMSMLEPDVVGLREGERGGDG